MKQNGRWKEAKEKTRQNILSGILSFFIKKLNEKKKALTVFSAFIAYSLQTYRYALIEFRAGYFGSLKISSNVVS